MVDAYRLYELEYKEFEALVGHICHVILGTGTITFADGKDGGRDGRFTGTSNRFPSLQSPATGKFIVQAKHTIEPMASCSDKSFEKILTSELPKLDALIADDELDYYLLFTNRRLTAGKEKLLRKKMCALKGIKDAWVIGFPLIDSYLKENKNLVKICNLDKFRAPFKIIPEDLALVVSEFYIQRPNIKAQDGSHNFNYVQLKQKNKINKLSTEYFEYIESDSMRFFMDIKSFLENPRNVAYQEQYQATSDELKAKLIVHKDKFDGFDETINFLYDEFIESSNLLKRKRRLVNVFLHYMYCNCDIGRHA